MRLFIGCFVQIEGYDHLKSLLAPLFEGNWVNEGNLHLTFKFLGEVSDVAAVVRALDGLEFPRQRRIVFDRLGMFGQKILYATCGETELARLASAIDDRLAGSFAREKAFVPHVTLMRVRSCEGDACNGLLPPLPQGVSLEAKLKLLLIQSEPGRRGMVYKVLREF